MHEARLGELRDQGLLRLLWRRAYTTTFGDRSWAIDLQICDLIDERGLPLHRLLINAAHDVVIAAITAEDLVAGLTAARTRFKEGWTGWLESLRSIGIALVEVDDDWLEVAEKRFLYDTDEARHRLRTELRQLQDPEVVAARVVLGVTPTDDVGVLKAARKSLAKQWHPDRAPAGKVESYTARMREINMAFDLLCSLLANSEV